MLIRNAELDGGRVADLRCQQGMVTAVSESLSPLAGETIIDAGGAALLPGLHDHHIHLLAFAAAGMSIVCGPPEVTDAKQLHSALQAVPGSGWIRGIGYHDSVAGELDRWQLDTMVPNRPVRIQHRSGKMWIVNTAAVEYLQLDQNRHLAGIECNKDGIVNGRLFRLDDWLRLQLQDQGPPDLALISVQLASYGVTGVTDATPTNSVAQAAIFQRAIESGTLLQRVLMMGDINLPEPAHRFLQRGAYKLLLDEHRLPDIDAFTADIALAHRQQRPVAIHCVTRTELIFALSALLVSGRYPGDRIEHASITLDDMLPLMQQAGVAIVTQHGFIRERGEQYLLDVNPKYHDLLYRGSTYLTSGLPLAGSSDAPYGPADPWLAMRAAVTRTTAKGNYLGREESLSPEQALALYTADPMLSGGVRRIALGEVADFCLLDRPWTLARERLDAADVRLTIRAGEIIYRRAH